MRPEKGHEGVTRLVICDDVPDIRMLFRIALEEASDIVVVAEAGTGKECLQAVADHDPDVVLLDLSMPDMDGLEVLVEIRHRPTPAVVVVSGYAASQMRARVMEFGALDYVEKGAPIARIRDAVRHAAAATRDAA